MSTELATRLVRLEEVSVPGVELSWTGLTITDPDLSYEAFERVAVAGHRFKTAASWWLGDLCNFGERLYGERYAQAMDISGYSYDHLKTCAYVCRMVARSRRRDNLGFSIHREVAPLEPDEQSEWLDAASANGWTVAQLRAALRDSRPPAPPRSEPMWSKDEPITPATPEQVEQAEEEAKKTLARPLPEGHPLWRTQAEAHARDVIALAPSAREAVGAVLPPEEAETGVSLRSAVQALLGHLEPLSDGFYRVPRAAVDELALLVGEE